MRQQDLLTNNFAVNEQATIKEVMAAMNDNQRGTVVIIDDQFHVIGVVSDGEIRRALVEGREIVSPVINIVNLNPVVIEKDKNKEIEARAEDIFKKNPDIHLLPVVDEKNKLIDVIIRDPQRRK